MHRHIGMLTARERLARMKVRRLRILVADLKTLGVMDAVTERAYLQKQVARLKRRIDFLENLPGHGT
jgi:hypothetical protein